MTAMEEDRDRLELAGRGHPSNPSERQLNEVQQPVVRQRPL